MSDDEERDPGQAFWWHWKDTEKSEWIYARLKEELGMPDKEFEEWLDKEPAILNYLIQIGRECFYAGIEWQKETGVD